MHTTQHLNALRPVSVVEFATNGLTAGHMEPRGALRHVAFDSQTAIFGCYEFAELVAIVTMRLFVRVLENVARNLERRSHTRMLESDAIDAKSAREMRPKVLVPVQRVCGGCTPQCAASQHAQGAFHVGFI